MVNKCLPDLKDYPYRRMQYYDSKYLFSPLSFVSKTQCINTHSNTVFFYLLGMAVVISLLNKKRPQLLRKYHSSCYTIPPLPQTVKNIWSRLFLITYIQCWSVTYFSIVMLSVEIGFIWLSPYPSALINWSCNNHMTASVPYMLSSMI